MAEVFDQGVSRPAEPNRNVSYRKNRILGTIAATVLSMAVFPLPSGPVEATTNSLVSAGTLVGRNAYNGFLYDFKLFTGDPDATSASAGP